MPSQHDTITVQSLLDEIQSRLAARIDPVYREGASRFFRHEVRLHGVRQKDLVPIEQYVYRVIKLWPLPQRNRLCDELWKEETMEEGTIVCHVYRRFAPQCGACEFKLFERWIDRYVHNWAHCDGVSTWLIAASLANDPSLLSNLPAWTESHNIWKRRSAAVSLLQEAKQGANTELILTIASRLSADASDMVQKGVGWVLKETYPQRPREVVSFLRASQPPRLVLRYAAEKMTAADRARVLG
jgi:3-methyladenine DNA glycosylase AlkD